MQGISLGASYWIGLGELRGTEGYFDCRFNDGRYGQTTFKVDVRAYEFGREMQTWTELRGGGSLSKAIDEFSSGLGVNPPYDASNDCVKRGYSDAQDNKESPYNNEGKSWTSF